MAVSETLPRLDALRRKTLRQTLETECLLVVAFAGIAWALALALPREVVGDTWLNFVDGRWIAQHGLPHADAMTVWAHGRPWVDQQWLAHLAMYEVVRVGGIKLILALTLVLNAAALLIAALTARLSGASARSTAFCLLTGVLVAPWMLQARAQSFALTLFVGVYALLASDSRHASRRVFLVLPLLALWANIHGTAVMGVGLVFVHAVLSVRAGLMRAAALALAAPAMLLASPYGFDLIGYYRLMLYQAPLRQYIDEWMPLSPKLETLAFLVASFAVVFLLARHATVLSLFERVALSLLIAAGFFAARNTDWLGLAIAVSGPLLLDAEWRPTAGSQRRLNLILSSAAVSVAVIALGVRFAQPESALLRWFPSAGADAVSAASGTHGRVLADDTHSDWLLWKDPALVDRIAYDVRFELLNAKQLASLQAFRAGLASHDLKNGYRVLTFESVGDARRSLGIPRVVYRSHRFIVAVQTSR